jgi:cation diffusion facilitator CzcD-associated flavoprotein CzcO
MRVRLTYLIHHSHWEWPDIPGIHDFKGHKVHSASWDHSYDYSHKRIGIIGNGSSAIQILPQMAKLAGTKVISFQRGATWITQSLGQTLGVGECHGDDEADEEGDRKMEDGANDEVHNPDGTVNMAKVDEQNEDVGSNFNPRYTSKDQRRFRNPQKLRQYRKTLQHGMNKGFRLVCFTSYSQHFRRHLPEPQLT